MKPIVDEETLNNYIKTDSLPKEEQLKLYIRQLKLDIENEYKESWNGGYKLTRLGGELSGVKKTLSVLGIDLKEYDID